VKLNATTPAVAPKKEAWDLYLRGEHAMNLGDPPGFHAAVKYFEQAGQKDPGFALAAAGEAAARAYLGIYFDDPRDQLPKAKSKANAALRLDESLQEAEGVLGLVALVHEWDYAEAQRRLVMASGRIYPEAMSPLACTVHLMSAVRKAKMKADQELRVA